MGSAPFRQHRSLSSMPKRRHQGSTSSMMARSEDKMFEGLELGWPCRLSPARHSCIPECGQNAEERHLPSPRGTIGLLLVCSAVSRCLDLLLLPHGASN
jgi:hypothetical protein